MAHNPISYASFKQFFYLLYAFQVSSFESFIDPFLNF